MGKTREGAALQIPFAFQTKRGGSYEKNSLWRNHRLYRRDLFDSAYGAGNGHGVHGNGGDGLWGLLLGYHAVLPLLLSLGVVIIGTGLCVWGAFEKKK